MTKGFRVTYEWDAESVHIDGDVIEHYHADKLESLKWASYTVNDDDTFFRIVLVRDVWGIRRNKSSVLSDDDIYLSDRTWCYVTQDGILPKTTDSGKKIPKKYLKEFEQNKEWASKLGDRMEVGE